MSENITTRCGSMFGSGMRLPRKSRDKTRTLLARVLKCFVWFDEILYYSVYAMLYMCCEMFVCLVISTYEKHDVLGNFLKFLQ